MQSASSLREVEQTRTLLHCFSQTTLQKGTGCLVHFCSMTNEQEFSSLGWHLQAWRVVHLSSVLKWPWTWKIKLKFLSFFALLVAHVHTGAAKPIQTLDTNGEVKSRIPRPLWHESNLHLKEKNCKSWTNIFWFHNKNCQKNWLFK